MNSNSKRHLILFAASTIVKTLGAEKLTLEAVAKEAGISKGGLLHHFPNKQALINAMVEESTNSYFSNINERAAQTSGAGKWSRAYIEATFVDVNDEHGIEMNAAIIASLFTNPELLIKLQTEYSNLQKKIENDGLDPVLGTIVRLAVDGLWFSEILRVGDLDSELREKVIQYLTNMTKGD
ncbi:TetR/AcrR family transcriptional regulator [Paenibacillus harenae]|uniref:AcrR family transcriptional regulator n=1 Tax=Paenibacillus harenae TaxID=306543 RepID=A0ABT9UCF0_PAEHA|nr:TetR/AcrR family transcriptional regulator [Paenibacillus harenae]MDQ0116129.1 AcrR family transcriptional regulator [Paenibacillus harenae]